MPHLPRIDQVEAAIQDQLANGTILNQLTNELIDELEALELLRPLLKARVKNIVLSYKEDDEISEEPTNQENFSSEQAWLKTLSKVWHENQVDRYYLERRDSYELVTFELFRTQSKGIISEAYQRLIENEESWKTIVERWGIKADKNRQGRYHQIRASKINQEVYRQLKRLKAGEISEPFRCANLLTVTKLIEWNHVQLNENMKEKLISELFNNWLEEQVNKVLENISQQD